MITLQDNNYVLNTKSFLMPWQKSDISYDALLGISLTLKSNVTGKVYLSTYIKTKDRLILGIDLHNSDLDVIPLIREDIAIGQGISYIQLMDNEYLRSGVLTVINTYTTETFRGEPVQISPKYINKEQVYSNKELTVNTDKLSNKINLTGNNAIFIDGLDTQVYESDIVTSINHEDEVQLGDDNITGILSIDGMTAIDGIITLKLPTNTQLIPVPDSANKTNVSTVLVQLPTPSIADPYAMYYDLYNADATVEEAPLNVCFTSISHSFAPKRIDNIKFTNEKLDWHSLSAAVGDTKQ